jgi:hypothetical protein
VILTGARQGLDVAAVRWTACALLLGARPLPVAAQEGPPDQAAAISTLRDAIDRHYSHRDRTGVSWDDAFREHRARLEEADTPRAFAEAAARLLSAARDVHVWLEVDGEIVPSFRREASLNLDLARVRKAVPDLAQLSRAVYSGRCRDATPYLLLGSLDPKRVSIEAIDSALRGFHGAPALILDLRANGGGSEELARKIAACFVQEPVAYARHVVRTPDGPEAFSAPRERVLEPAGPERPRFDGKVAVLQGRFTLSSAEALVLMMRQVPGCVTVGDTTYGSSGNPKPYDLGNGVVVRLPSWKAMDAEGRELEGVGIAPDVRVEVDTASPASGDAILEEALEILGRDDR